MTDITIRNYLSGAVSKQEVADFAMTKLLEQNAVSMEGMLCMYRGPNGLKCAVGHLMPDEEYKPEMDDIDDSISAEHLILEYYGDVTGRTFGVSNFLVGLQNVHDLCRESPVEEFAEDLKRHARTFYNLYGLNYTFG